MIEPARGGTAKTPPTPKTARRSWLARRLASKLSSVVERREFQLPLVRTACSVTAIGMEGGEPLWRANASATLLLRSLRDWVNCAPVFPYLRSQKTDSHPSQLQPFGPMLCRSGAGGGGGAPAQVD